MPPKLFHSNPFPGIRSYEIHESHLFYGRELQVRELTGKLSDTRFLAIVGSSGCGKSSLIKAGLIPELQKTTLANIPSSWQYMVFRPADDPIGNLASAVSAIQPDKTKAEAMLRSGKMGLANLIREGLNANHATLIVIDQFEELFRFKSNRTSFHTILDANDFIDLILTLVQQTDLSAFMAISMRTDFLDDCTEFRGLSELINKGYYLVPRMNQEERKIAITGPINAAGSSVTDELLSRLLDDVGDDPDQLPILQHAMMRTWDYYTLNRIGEQPIGLEHYLAIGSMKEALSVHLEELYADLKDPKSQYQAEKMFKALTDITRESRGTRRPMLLTEICTLAGAREEEIIRIIENFRKPGCTFLMPPAHIALNADSTIDIAHESIMRVWTRLRKWVEEESHSAQLYLRLSKSAELYQEGKTGLWVNPELQLALQWKEATKPNATWATRYDPAFDRAMTFLDYSKKQHDLELSKKEKQQKRNLKRARSSAIVLGIASLVSILFLIISLNLRFKAEASRKEALEKEKLAISERKQTEEQRKEAILQKKISEQQQQIAEQQEMITEHQRKYAVEQQLIAQKQTVVAINEKRQADLSKHEAIVARDEAQEQRKAAVSQKQIADQERIKAEESEKKTQRLRLLAISKTMAIQAEQLYTSKKDEFPPLVAVTAYKLNIENGGIETDPAIYSALSEISTDPRVLRGHEDAVRSAVATKNGKSLFSCGDDNKILHWNLNNLTEQPSQLEIPKGMKEGFRCLALTRNEEWLISGTTSGKLLIWKQKDLLQPQKIIPGAHASIVQGITAHPLQNLFFTCGSDGKLIQWRYDKEPFETVVLDSVSGTIRCMAISPDGRKLLYEAGSGMIRIIDPDKTPVKPILFMAMQSPVTSMTFSHDGKSIAMGCQDGSVHILNSKDPGHNPEALIGRHASAVTGVSFSPNDRLLASAGYDWSVKLSDFPIPDEKPISVGHDHWVYGAVFSADSKQILSFSADKTIKVFSTQNSLMADVLKKSLKRNMTPTEWDKMVGKDVPYQKSVETLP
jgi:WD40 repeat protein